VIGTGGNYEEEDPPERKWLDTPADVSATNTEISQTVQIYLLNGMDKGNTANDRKGNIIRIRNIFVRGTVEHGIVGNGVSDASLISIWLVWDKQPNGVAMTAADFLQYGSGSGGNGDPSSTFLNMSNSMRFVVLRRFMKLLGPVEKETGQVGYTGSPSNATLDWIVDCDLQTVYNRNTAGAGGISQISTGALYLVFAGDIAPHIPAQLDFAWKSLWHARIRFEDVG